MFKLLSFVVLLPACSIIADSRGKLRLKSAASRHANGQMQMAAGRSRRGRHGLQGPTEMLEEWKDHGKAVNSRLSETDIVNFASKITTEVYGKELHSFIDSRPSRFVANNGNAATAGYIKEQLQSLGLDVSEQSVDDPRIDAQYPVNLLEEELNAKHTNVIGVLRGTDLAHEVVLVGAHYDSVNWENTEATAPGVDDNGSGSALLLTLARAFSAAPKNLRPRRTVMFVAFNAEEEGLVGSEHFAKSYSKDKYGELKAAFIADEVAWPGRGQERRMAIFETNGHSDATNAMVDTLARAAMSQNATSKVKGDGIGDGQRNFVVNYQGFGSDHMSFLDEGLPAVLLIERDDDYHADTWGHSSRDTFEHVDLSYGAAMSRLALRAVAAFASPADKQVTK